MKNILKFFAADEDGAVTVDWVVLTAAVVSLGVLVLMSVSDASVDLAGRISTEISKVEP